MVRTANIRTKGTWETEGFLEVDTTSLGQSAKDLSPFCLHHPSYPSVLVENFWQYSKFYREHGEILYAIGGPRNFYFGDECITLPEIKVTDAFRAWANQGMVKKYSDRHPMGRGAKPVCSVLSVNKHYYACDYIQARKLLYVPAYAGAVKGTRTFRWLQCQVSAGQDIMLLDFDDVDFSRGFDAVLNDGTHVMGHSAVLAAMLSGEYPC